MLQLLGDNKLKDDILTKLLLQRMPPILQATLASSREHMRIEETAEIAGRIVEVLSNDASAICHTASAASVAPRSYMSDQYEQLRTEMQKLTAEVGRLSRDVNDL